MRGTALQVNNPTVLPSLRGARDASPDLESAWRLPVEDLDVAVRAGGRGGTHVRNDNAAYNRQREERGSKEGVKREERGRTEVR